jgi:hypothetical protein
MPDPIVEQIDALPKLSKSTLCEQWKKLFQVSPPPKLRRQLLIPILAYRLQEQMLGSLKASTLLRLRQLARPVEAKSSSTLLSLKPGTRLVRQWRDQVHLVNVGDSGYEYQGIRYQNLSQIARQITGTRWSGPAFFGLKNEQKNHPKEVR